MQYHAIPMEGKTDVGRDAMHFLLWKIVQVMEHLLRSSNNGLYMPRYLNNKTM